MPTENLCYDADHTPVDCGVDMAEQVNDELLRLTNNVNFLKRIFEITRMGQALFICDAAVTGVSLSDPVYYDPTSGSFKPSKISFTESAGELKLDASSQCHGLVSQYVDGANTATILIFGIASVDMSNSTGFASPTGLFYLTRNQAKLSLEVDAAVESPVLFAMGDGNVMFRPQWTTPHSLYRIRKYELTPTSAGNFVIESSRVTITGDGDPTKRGWLPADAPSFDGLTVPANAKFGYNLNAHIEVQEAWPPSPLELARLEWQVEGDGRGGAGNVSPDLVQMNADGIWWMSDCVDQVPWTSSGANSACGDRVSAALNLYFPYSVQNDTGKVTSLKSKTSSLKVLREGSTQVATSGALELELDINFAMGSEVDNEGAIAIKGFDNEGLLSRGPIVSFLKSNSPELQISGGSVTADGRRYGSVELTLGGPQKAELIPLRIALDGAVTDESYTESLALGLPPGQYSSIRSQFYIPQLTYSDFFLVQYETWISAAAAGRLPELTANARAWEPPSGSTPVDAPTSDTALTFAVPSISLKTGQYVQVISGAFAVRSGSMLSLQLLRDGAAGDVSSIQARLIKQLLRIIKPAGENDVTNPETPVASGIYATEYANQYG